MHSQTYICPYLYILFVSARIPVSICMYHCWYLHVPKSDSARILVSICTYPNQYLQVYLFRSAPVLFISECIPVCICLCPVCVCLCNSMHIRPNICPAGQPNNPPSHTHTQAPVHCAAFFLRLRVSASALPVPRQQPPVLKRLDDCTCCLADDYPRSIACLPTSLSDRSWESLSMAMVHLDAGMLFSHPYS